MPLPSIFYSDAADNAQGTLSNFVQVRMQETGEARPPAPQNADPRTVACKPAAFGSVSAASLEFPVADITRYLGLQLLDTALADYLLVEPDLGMDANNWAARQATPNLDETSLTRELRAEHRDPNIPDKIIRVTPRPALTSTGKRQRIWGGGRATQSVRGLGWKA